MNIRKLETKTRVRFHRNLQTIRSNIPLGYDKEILKNLNSKLTLELSMNTYS